jgi:hypothetical protein
VVGILHKEKAVFDVKSTFPAKDGAFWFFPIKFNYQGD